MKENNINTEPTVLAVDESIDQHTKTQALKADNTCNPNSTYTNTKNNKKRSRGFKHRNNKAHPALDNKEKINNNASDNKRIRYEKVQLLLHDPEYEYYKQEYGDMDCTLHAINNVAECELLTSEELTAAGNKWIEIMHNQHNNPEGFYKPAHKKKSAGEWDINCVTSSLKSKYGSQIQLKVVEQNEIISTKGRYICKLLNPKGIAHLVGITHQDDNKLVLKDPLCKPMQFTEKLQEKYLNGGKIHGTIFQGVGKVYKLQYQ